MKINTLLLIFISLLLIRCENKPRECDDFGPFEERWIHGTYKDDYVGLVAMKSVKISSSLVVTIDTSYNLFNNASVSKGILQYEITEGPDCICSGGYDSELGCQFPSAIYKGRGTITLTSSNDSICDVDILDVEFTSYWRKTVLTITGGDCFELQIEKSFGDI
jgi:hypothetical protein